MPRKWPLSELRSSVGSPLPAHRAPLQLGTPLTWHLLCAGTPRTVGTWPPASRVPGWLANARSYTGAWNSGCDHPALPAPPAWGCRGQGQPCPIPGHLTADAQPSLSPAVTPHPKCTLSCVGLTSWRGTGTTGPVPAFSPPARASGRASPGVAASPARPPQELSCSIQKCVLSGEPPPAPPALTLAPPEEERLAGGAHGLPLPSRWEGAQPRSPELSHAARSQRRSVGRPHATQSRQALGESRPRAALPGGRRRAASV